MKRLYISTLLPALLMLAATEVFAQTANDRSVIAAGGVQAANATLLLSGTIGQPVIGPALTLHRTTWQGFWYSQPSVKASVPVPGSTTATLDCAPNPITRSATITVNVPAAGNVSLTLHDLLGRTVQRLVNAPHQAGEFSVELNTEELPEGRYTVRFSHSLGESSLPVLVVR